MNNELKKSSEIALRDCLNLQKNESLMVLTDDRTQMIGETLFTVGKELCDEAILVVMPEREVPGIKAIA